MANDDTFTQVHKKTVCVNKTLVLSWTSDSVDGSVDGDTESIDGLIHRVVTNPSATAPDDNYNVYLRDSDGWDVLTSTVGAAQGENRDETNTESIVLDPPAAVSGPLTLAIDTAGNSKNGTITIYYR